MRSGYLFTAIGLALFSALHVFVTYEHSRQVGPGRESVLAPAVMAVLSAGLAIWALRRVRRTS
jgi:hypothetical protein